MLVWRHSCAPLCAGHLSHTWQHGFAVYEFGQYVREALSKLLKCEGGAGAEGAILPYVGHLQLISTLKIGADCCQLCQYKLS